MIKSLIAPLLISVLLFSCGNRAEMEKLQLENEKLRTELLESQAMGQKKEQIADERAAEAIIAENSARTAIEKLEELKKKCK